MKPRLMQAIVIQLKPSPLLLGMLGCVSIVCCAILAQLQLSLAIKLGLIILVVFSTIYFSLRDVLLLLPQSWQSVEVNSQGTLKLTNKQGIVFEPKLADSSFIHEYVTILNFKRSGFKWCLLSVILFTSQENQEELRKLRVWLRWWKRQEDLSAA